MTTRMQVMYITNLCGDILKKIVTGKVTAQQASEAIGHLNKARTAMGIAFKKYEDFS